MSEPATRLAPYERPPLRRGARGWAAALCPIGAVVALAFMHLRGTSSGGTGDARYSVAITEALAHPLEAHVLWLAVLAGLVAAAVLWRAHSRRLVALATAAVAAAAVGAAWGVANARSHSSPSPIAFNLLYPGMSQASVVTLLGEPLAASVQATPVDGGATLPCLLYAVGGPGHGQLWGPGEPQVSPSPVRAQRSGWLPVAPGAWGVALCFSAGRLVDRINA
ncbi:MAG: hypothetical protein ABSG64_01850 [Solirubrobacteraceae bacterium]